MKHTIYLIILLLFNSCGFFKPDSVPHGIDEFAYEPFGKNGRGSKTAILPESSTLKLTDNLPKLDGATAIYPLYAAFVQAVYPEGDYYTYHNPIVGMTTTPKAYENLINGKVDIIFCAKPSNEQIERAKEKGVNFNMTPIGKEAFVFFVNKKNPVNNLSIEQVRNIYSGKTKKWSALGGKHRKIIAYQRPKNSGSQTILESIMGEENIVKPLTENVVEVMDGIINRTAEYRNHKNAIGYSFLFYTTQMVRNDKIKLLSINGVLPSKETILNETYFYTDSFYAITTDTDNENVNAFVDWILSEQGQYLVDKTGYVPVK
ncbi:MAG: substrate-binding domain-containing protein [Treponema sp.]|jgi:phosphate transport system substrate-binding protein|nr:substrate-binding domain-containing protein [Treponema sp.]